MRSPKQITFDLIKDQTIFYAQSKSEQRCAITKARIHQNKKQTYITIIDNQYVWNIK